MHRLFIRHPATMPHKSVRYGERSHFMRRRIWVFQIFMRLVGDPFISMNFACKYRLAHSGSEPGTKSNQSEGNLVSSVAYIPGHRVDMIVRSFDAVPEPVTSALVTRIALVQNADFEFLRNRTFNAAALRETSRYRPFREPRQTCAGLPLTMTSVSPVKKTRIVPRPQPSLSRI